jgi:acyl-CoA thioesterase
MTDAYARALTFDQGLSAHLSGDFSNGPIGAPPEAGFPFGGLLAALCAKAMREGLAIEAPLRTLSVQYLAAAKFEAPMSFRPRLLRGGRTVAYSAVEAGQGERLTHHATATWGVDAAEANPLAPLASAPPLHRLEEPSGDISGPMAPRFSQHVDYRFDGGPFILGGNEGRPVVERLWMRLKGGQPLDADGLCYLLDALYPPAWTAFSLPPPMTTVDLRYDILADPTPKTAPDGWAFFEFRMLDFGRGWTVDEATCWGADGSPLAVARQRRKLVPQRRGAG